MYNYIDKDIYFWAFFFFFLQSYIDIEKQTVIKEYKIKDKNDSTFLSFIFVLSVILRIYSINAQFSCESTSENAETHRLTRLHDLQFQTQPDPNIINLIRITYNKFV